MFKDALEKMGADKKYRLINSSLEEFSRNTYEKASTNTIVKKAGISKGLLFHFFESKNDLYEYIKDFSINITADAVMKNINWDQTDLFVRIKEVALAKFEIFSQYPYMAAFAKSLLVHKSKNNLKKEIEASNPNIYKQIYYKNIDFSLFKDATDQEKAVKIIQSVVESVCMDWLNLSGEHENTYDLKLLGAELDSYMKILKEAFYK